MRRISNCVSWWSDSYDNLAKQWSTDLDLMAESRGVWCVKFSPEDSGSVVAALKRWALGKGGGSCVKTLESHDTRCSG